MTNQQYTPPPGPVAAEQDLFELGDLVEHATDRFGSAVADVAAQAALLAAQHVVGVARGESLPGLKQERTAFSEQSFITMEQKANLALSTARSFLKRFDELARDVETCITQVRGFATLIKSNRELELANLTQRVDSLASELAKREAQITEMAQLLEAAGTNWAELPPASVVVQELIDKAYSASLAAERFTETRQRVAALERTIDARDRARQAARSQGLRVRAAALGNEFTSEEIELLIAALQEAQKKLPANARVAA